MPANYPRTEVHFPPELSAELERFKKEVYEKTGHKTSMNAIIVEIVRQFFSDRNQSCFSPTK